MAKKSVKATKLKVGLPFNLGEHVLRRTKAPHGELFPLCVGEVVVDVLRKRQDIRNADILRMGRKVAIDDRADVEAGPWDTGEVIALTNPPVQRSEAKNLRHRNTRPGKFLFPVVDEDPCRDLYDGYVMAPKQVLQQQHFRACPASVGDDVYAVRGRKAGNNPGNLFLDAGLPRSRTLADLLECPVVPQPRHLDAPRRVVDQVCVKRYGNRPWLLHCRRKAAKPAVEIGIRQREETIVAGIAQLTNKLRPEKLKVPTRRQTEPADRRP